VPTGLDLALRPDGKTIGARNGLAGFFDCPVEAHMAVATSHLAGFVPVNYPIFLIGPILPEIRLGMI